MKRPRPNFTFNIETCAQVAERHRIEEDKALYESGKCLICNDNLSEANLNICTPCTLLGFEDHIVSTDHLGVRGSKLIHTIHIVSEMPEIRLKGFLQSLILSNFKGIIWTDLKNMKSLEYVLSSYKLSNKCEIKNIEILLNNFLDKNNSLTYLNYKTKKSILGFIQAELNSVFGKVAYAVDILRMIVLQQYGGFYIDSNVRILKREIQTVNHLGKEQRHSGIMYLGRGDVSHNAEEADATSYKLYEKLRTKPGSKKFYPHECSAIYANKGNIFFDFVLYNFFDVYIKNPIFSHESGIYNDSKYNSRTPSIINCMMVAQYLMEIKFNLRDYDFTLKTDEFIEAKEIKLKDYSFDAVNYIGVLPFSAFGYNWGKYYSHSHKTSHEFTGEDYKTW
ncbi:glycosyltransferase [Francisella frigiditurris]|uniref:Glycosyltransferase sugar-binding region containing DXD motif family protein n=1 Tax=Francisella frigiditurris TaxID=1542390 RepID=A0A1J0KRQ4_9GAMM|nr:glycosyltransferase [Francisella frigiditurris]APC96378.1 glycosyltransferase sugar-binding region containing DXD motif family protein [Francisella frigiditurris]